MCFAGACSLVTHGATIDEEADDMNDHEYAFRHRQLSCAEDVETRCSNEEEHNE